MEPLADMFVAIVLILGILTILVSVSIPVMLMLGVCTVSQIPIWVRVVVVLYLVVEFCISMRKIGEAAREIL